LKEPAQGVKVLLQMIVGVVGSVIVIATVVEDIHGGRTATYMEKHALVIIAASLAVAASLELACTPIHPWARRSYRSADVGNFSSLSLSREVANYGVG
jgi:hypothetical protein